MGISNTHKTYATLPRLLDKLNRAKKNGAGMDSKLLTDITLDSESDYETSSSPCIRHLRLDL